MTGGSFHVRSLHGGFVTAVDACSSHSFTRHSHDEFGIGLMTSGAQRSWSGHGAVEACMGNIITVNPGEVHDGAPIGAARGWSMLYFPVEVVTPFIADLSEGKVTMCELPAPVMDDARASSLFEATRADLIEAGPSNDLDEHLLLLFASLFDVMSEPPPGSSHRLACVRERIDDDPAASHPLFELAALAGMSRFRTLRSFARLTGLTPRAYVIQRRLDIVRRLIRRGSALAEVAAGAGFTDQSHMHRAFVSRYGYTPGVYARASGR